MALLDVTGIGPVFAGQYPVFAGQYAGGHTPGQYAMTQYCPVTEQVLSGYARHGAFLDDGSDRARELQSFLQVYISAGKEKDALGIRAPLVFWLVMCGWITPQAVLSAMASENAGQLDEADLARLFNDRWILESLLEHWPAGEQHEYQLEAVRRGGHAHDPRLHSNGGLIQIVTNDGRRESFTTDKFTAVATSWSQSHGHIGPKEAQQLTNEPALPALLARPQIFKPAAGGFEGPGENQLVSLRWRDLVKYTLRTLVKKKAGPVTARLVFESISQGLCYFRQERGR